MLVPCEPDDLHSEVMSAADDYLWLKLCQVRDQSDPENKLTLDHLQTTIVEIYGEAGFHFVASEFIALVNLLVFWPPD